MTVTLPGFFSRGVDVWLVVTISCVDLCGEARML